MTKLLDAGCDCIHFTMPAHGEQYEQARHIAEQQRRQEKDFGHDVNEIAPSGYRGTQCGSIFAGERGFNALFQSRAHCAKETLEFLKREGIRCNVTRLDWQATFRPGKSAKKTSRRYRDLTCRIGQGLAQSAASNIRAFENPDLHNSFYIQSADRESIFRTYHKSAESPGSYPDNTWRHEWQVTGRRCRESYQMWLSASSQEALALSHIKGFLLQYDVDEDFLNEIPPSFPPKRRSISDRQRRLLWWSNSAVPCALKMLDDKVTLHYLVSEIENAARAKGIL